MKKIIFTLLTIFPLLACQTNHEPKSYSFELANLGDNVSFHTELQAKYIASEDYLTTMGIASGSSSKEYPLPITLSYKGGPNNKMAPEHTYFDLFEEGKEEPIISKESNTTGGLDVYNLKLNTSYSYSVTVKYSSGKAFHSEESHFKTTDKGPRNLFVNNVMNIRDLGGHGIKQGLIYRSGRFNENDGTTKIDEETIKVMTKDLGVKTEIDLRRDDETGGITSSPLGESVSYIHLPMYYGGENVLTHVGEHSGVSYDNPAQIKVFFETLADEKNYPIDFHCAIGKDRTGCMAYLVEALCGMEEEYLYRDYLFSNFAKISGMCEVSDIDNKYGATIKEYSGASLQEKTYNYLNQAIGVSEANLKSIQSILIDK